MSRVRTGPRPEDWVLEEPREAHVVSRGGHLAVGVSAYDQARIAYRAAKLRELVIPPPAIPCGVLMPRIGGHCGRRMGHADAHRSREAMTAEALVRRTVRV